MASVDTILADLTTAGRGIFSAADARAAGIHPRTIEAAVVCGELIRLDRGWYTGDHQLTQERHHLLRARAAVASLGGRAVISHHSALIRHGLPVVGADLGVVHVARPAGLPGRRRAGLAIHELPAGAPPMREVAPPGWAVVQTGLTSGDRAALVAADAAVRERACSLEQIEEALLGYRRTPGVAGVRAVLRWVHTAAESPGETLLRYDLLRLDYQVGTQEPITTAMGRYRADLRIAGTPVLVEFDGLAKYDDPEVLRRERARESNPRANGWQVVRFVWDDLGYLDRIRTRVTQALAVSHSVPHNQPA